MAGERTVVRPSRSFDAADDPAGAPVTKAFSPDVVDPRCLVPDIVVVAGSERLNRAPAGAVSVPSGSIFQPRATSRSSSNAPHRAVLAAAPRTDNGHHARSNRYSTDSLLRPVSDAIRKSSR